MIALPGLVPPPSRARHPAADLAYRHAPLLHLDSREPYRPVAVGVTVFDAPAPSPSSKFAITPAAATVIEYAIYWDYDIKHVYDLEHVWVHLDTADKIVAVEGTRHGQRIAMPAAVQDNRAVLVVEPGEHAMFTAAGELQDRADRTRDNCTAGAGNGGIHVKNLFGAAAFGDPAPRAHRLARLHLHRHAFTPAFDAAVPVDCRDLPLLPWPDLAAWIPRRIRDLCAGLPRHVPHLAAVFLDCGDTLVDEGTEQKDGEVVLAAELVDGATRTLDALRDHGHRLALVADGPRKTFENVLGHYGLWDHFEVHAISGDVGHIKPSPKMFAAAVKALALTPAETGRVAMVGNNLARDVKGANNFGLISVFFDWSPRRPRTPAADDEVPDHTINHLDELVPLLDSVERSLPQN